MLARSKKLDICIKNIEYIDTISRGCFFGGKAEGLLKMLARFSENEGVNFLEKQKTPEALLKTLARSC